MPPNDEQKKKARAKWAPLLDAAAKAKPGGMTAGPGGLGGAAASVGQGYGLHSGGPGGAPPVTGPAGPVAPPTPAFRVPTPSRHKVAGAPGGLDMLAAGGGGGGGGIMSPLLAKALADPKSLTKMVNMGGTSSSTTNVRQAVGNMPGLQRGLDITAKAETAAINAQAKAEQARSGLLSAAYQKQVAEMEERQAAALAKEGEVEEQIAEHDKEAAQIRADLASQKVDPDSWWSSKTTGQKVGYGIAIALAGLGKAIAGKDGPNVVIDMMDRAVDRDIQAQKDNIMKRRGDLKDVQGIMAGLYQRLGSMRQAEAQARIMLKEQFASKLEQIAQQSNNPIIRARADAALAASAKRLLVEKNQAWQATRNVVTRSSSSSSQRVPLFKLLQAQMAQQKKGAQLKPPTDKTKTEAGNINSARKALIHYVHQYKKLKAKPGVTTWAGGEADAVVQLRKLTVDKLAVALGVDKAAMLEMLKGQLGTEWSSDKDVVTRVTNLGHALDAAEEEKLAAQAPYHNIRPLAVRGLKSRGIFWKAVGGEGGH